MPTPAPALIPEIIQASRTWFQQTNPVDLANLVTSAWEHLTGCPATCLIMPALHPACPDVRVVRGEFPAAFHRLGDQAVLTWAAGCEQFEQVWNLSAPNGLLPPGCDVFALPLPMSTTHIGVLCYVAPCSATLDDTLRSTFTLLTIMAFEALSHHLQSTSSERQRVVHELHANPAQTLFRLGLELEQIATHELPKDLQSSVETSQALAARASREVRAVMAQLADTPPPQTSRLISLLARKISDYQEQSGRSILLHAPDFPDLHRPELIESVYKIVKQYLASLPERDVDRSLISLTLLDNQMVMSIQETGTHPVEPDVLAQLGGISTQVGGYYELQEMDDDALQMKFVFEV